MSQQQQPLTNLVKLITSEAITHADLTKTLSGGTRSGVVTLIIGDRNLIVKSTGSAKFEAGIAYFDDAGKQFPLENNGVESFELSVSDFKALSQSINSSLVDTDNILDRFDEEIVAIAKQKFSESFGIDPELIERLID